MTFFRPFLSFMIVLMGMEIKYIGKQKSSLNYLRGMRIRPSRS